MDADTWAARIERVFDDADRLEELQAEIERDESLGETAKAMLIARAGQYLADGERGSDGLDEFLLGGV